MSATNTAFSAVAHWTARQMGRGSTFALACMTVILWAASGPLFHFSDTWQLVINTGTTIVTFLMVFLIQNTQNRDGAAIQAKLDELIRASAAHNRYIGIESLTEEELDDLRARCAIRASREIVGDLEAAADEAEAAADHKAREAARRVAGAPQYPS